MSSCFVLSTISVADRMGLQAAEDDVASAATCGSRNSCSAAFTALHRAASLLGSGAAIELCVSTFLLICVFTVFRLADELQPGCRAAVTSDKLCWLAGLPGELSLGKC